MGSLDGFRKDAKPKESGSSWARRDKKPKKDGQARKPRNPDDCPEGWDKDIWHLVLLFDQYARIDRIRLRAGRPVIYSVIADLVSSHGMRDRAKAGGYRHVAEHCERRDLPADLAARCWYHYPPHNPGEQVESTLTWVQMAEIIMAEFWSRVQDDHALDYFRQYFAEYGQAALQHWRSLGILVALGAQPKRPRDMRVPGPRASMPDADTDDPGMSLWMRMRAAKGWPTAAEAAAGAAKAVETLRRANESGS